MCIRDRFLALGDDPAIEYVERREQRGRAVALVVVSHRSSCLLYTSDAADERSSVDLGGCRIIKKKIKKNEKKKKKKRNENI